MAITAGKTYLGPTAIESCNTVKIGATNVTRMYVGECLIFPSALFSLNGQYSGTISSDVCNRTGTYPIQMFWVDCSSLDIGDYVWTDSSRTTLAPTGYYGGGGYSSTYYYVVNGVLSSINTCPCDPTPNPVYQEYYTCVGCLSFPVYRDINPCSSTYNYYRVNGEYVGLSAPSVGGCDTTQNKTFQYVTCIGCTEYEVYRDTNCSSPTYLHYFIKYNDDDYDDVGTNAPSNGSCDRSLFLQNQNYITCYGCGNYNVYRDINPCSSNYNNYYIKSNDDYNYTFYGPTQPPGGMCNYNRQLSFQDYYTCRDCVDMSVYKDTNPCSSTYNDYFVGVNEINVGSSAPPQSVCNYNIQLESQGYFTCIGCFDYLVSKDINLCSPTYNHYYVNGGNVGTTPPPDGGCDTTRQLTFQYVTCIGCTEYNVYRDTNCSSPTYLHYFISNNDVGTDAPSNSYCDYSQQLVDQGYSTCIGCNLYTVYRETNPCLPSLYYINGGYVDGVPSSDPCPSTVYYALTPCYNNPDSYSTQYTTIFPDGGYGQQYVLPDYYNNQPNFFYYQGSSVALCSGTPGGYNGSIELVSGASYCP
jgi:hypothetical protein